mmetsp:Transcript_16371/g.27975  ORF Transcript_16371/g.27975 Transcript_16371/m.27975 type:complete len:201 (+) Transcript_16371:334-936(+)
MAHSTCIWASASSSTRETRAAPYFSGSAHPHSGSGFFCSFSESKWKMSFSTDGRKLPCAAHHDCSSSPSFAPETNSSSSLASAALAAAAFSAASFSPAALAAAASSAALFSAAAFSAFSRFALSKRALAAASSSPGRVRGTSTGGSTTSSSRFLGARMLATLPPLLPPPRGGNSSAGPESCFHLGPKGSSIGPSGPPRPP